MEYANTSHSDPNLGESSTIGNPDGIWESLFSRETATTPRIIILSPSNKLNLFTASKILDKWEQDLDITFTDQ